MNILIVCSGTKGKISSFVNEQMESLSRFDDIQIELFQIKNKGYIGYLSHLWPLIKLIKNCKPDLIHAHYGLSGLLANLQRRIPVVTTFHGSDVNIPAVLRWSKWAFRLSKGSIFVEKTMLDKFRIKSRSFLIPCGVNLSVFYPMEKSKARKALNLDPDIWVVLFSSGFDNPNKNYPQSREACNTVEKKLFDKVYLFELKGLNRSEVNLYFNASDCCLLFSFSEGSPQFIKEAMACNCPIVSSDVGDVRLITGEIMGCYITSNNIEDLTEKLFLALNYSREQGRTHGRERIKKLGLDIHEVSKKISDVYKSCLN